MERRFPANHPGCIGLRIEPIGDLTGDVFAVDLLNQTTENLTALRRQIDGIDEQLLELLAKRMRISKEIGVYKKEHNMPILQSPRYSEILEKRSCMGEQMDLSPDFVKEILKEIHEESVRQQMIIMNEQ